MKPARMIPAAMMSGAMAFAVLAAPVQAQDDAKQEACEANPTHACVLDLLWSATPRVARDYQAETNRAFIDAAMLTGDKALIDLYLQRTGYRNTGQLVSTEIRIARARKDKAALIAFADKAESGAGYDWYQLHAIAGGLAEQGELARARKVADRIEHGPDDSVTAMNLHRSALDVISFHDNTPVTFRTWADRGAEDVAWWEDADLAFLQALAPRAARASELDAVMREIDARFKQDGWKYLRALARLAPQLASHGQASRDMFRGFVETWADPANEKIAELDLMIAARAHPDIRVAMLTAFDARLPSPSGRITRMRALAGDPALTLEPRDKGFLGLVGGTYEQRQAAIALATLSPEQFLADARTGESYFSLSRPAVLRAALDQTPDKAFALSIATLMAELGQPRTIDGYDYAQYATDWARETCHADLYNIASSRLARTGEPEEFMWNARFDHNPAQATLFLTLGDSRITTGIARQLGAYEDIILNGYCQK